MNQKNTKSTSFIDVKDGGILACKDAGRTEEVLGAFGFGRFFNKSVISHAGKDLPPSAPSDSVFSGRWCERPTK